MALGIADGVGDDAGGSEPFVEMDPTGRFGRYVERLGAGAAKTVYRGFDEEEGIEVAWNQIDLRRILAEGGEDAAERIFKEVRLLRSLRHRNVIRLYGEWTDDRQGRLNFITEVCTSGSLREYRARHRNVSVKAIKKWARQVLVALDYLHTHDPCIVHRDLNCSNVFINGNIGQVKLGDFGLAAVVGKGDEAHSAMGTPEFMPAEQFEDNYTEHVDIYAFGMCVLEMYTNEIPYKECDSLARIYKRVLAGVGPASLQKVDDPEVKAFIHKCLGPHGKPRQRPSATDLLRDPFFHGLDDDRGRH